MTCIDPAADLSLVMYNTDTKNDREDYDDQDD